jgi:hypothetical protein
MKLELFLIFALGAFSTSACDVFYFCHCYDGDGLYHNLATAAVCAWQGGELYYATYDNGPDTNNYECFDEWEQFSNCDWRDKCHQAGATGSDSSCWCGGDCDPPVEGVLRAPKSIEQSDSIYQSS